MFLSSILSGIFISIGCIINLFMLYNNQKLLGSIFFSIGLILVFICQTKLFTGSIMDIFHVLNHKLKFIQMIKNWFIIYIGNFIGCVIMSIFIFYSKSFNNDMINIVNHIITLNIHKSFITLIFLGILCNMLVCLSVYMNWKSKSLIEKIFIPILPITIFVFCGFQHSIADMFYLSINLLYNNINFYLLIPVTIGNIIGGLFIGIILYFKHP